VTESTRWSRLLRDADECRVLADIGVRVEAISAGAATHAARVTDTSRRTALELLATAVVGVGVNDVAPGFQRLALSAYVLGDANFSQYDFSLDGQTYGVHAAALYRRAERLRLVPTAPLERARDFKAGVACDFEHASAAASMRPQLPPLQTSVRDLWEDQPFVSAPLPPDGAVIRMWAPFDAEQDPSALRPVRAQRRGGRPLAAAARGGPRPRYLCAGGAPLRACVATRLPIRSFLPSLTSIHSLSVSHPCFVTTLRILARTRSGFIVGGGRLVPAHLSLLARDPLRDRIFLLAIVHFPSTP